MQKRDFLIGGTASIASTLVPGSLVPANASTRLRTLKQEVDGVKRSWSYKKLRDPTGSAPSSRVERFEIRNGDCKGGDCRRYSGRIERHVVTNLSHGESGRFSYNFYLPSEGYNYLPNVISNLGQVFLYDKPRSDWDGGPLWMFEAGPGSRKISAKVSTFRKENGRLIADTKGRYALGDVGRTIQLDRWHQGIVDFKLASNSNGSVETYLNGKRAMRYKGPTSLEGAVAGMSYGIYQNHTNRFPGGAKAIPAQVIYYSNVQMVRT